MKKVVTACPHCFNAIKNEWKDFGGTYEVIHHTQLIGKLIKEGKLKPTKGTEQKITYHDSCYIGRWNQEYEAPRAILNALPMAKVQEMEKNSANGMCCGAGGGRMWMEEHIGTRVNIKRTEQALATNASTIAANCPFCMTMLTDGVKSKDMAEKVKVVDIAELIDQATI
ncbi:MAG: (Fe-S)-binding protein [Deltaproteobacteria bacterium]|nr:(Fe-S)-binding protein [Deltaproteobacteria bacterium]